MQSDRRRFLQHACFAAAAIPFFGERAADASEAIPDDDKHVNIFGPKAGYAPTIGILVSQLKWMRMVVLSSVKKMTQPQLDFLLDDKANRIGALLMHLAATETYYGLHTFDGAPWGNFPEAATKKFDVAMELGAPARKAIVGNNLDYYLQLLHDARERTLTELKKRDDKWLLAVDEKWPWGPTNNFCKWFHVCEHESNHNGQIKLIKGRLPGAKPGE